MIIYSQSQSHYESAKSKLKAGDLCFIGDEKKIIFHKSAEGGDPVVYDAAVSKKDLDNTLEEAVTIMYSYAHPITNALLTVDDMSEPTFLLAIFQNENTENLEDEDGVKISYNLMPSLTGTLATEEWITRGGYTIAGDLTISGSETRINGTLKVRTGASSSGRIDCEGNISSSSSIYATDSLYAGSSNQTGYVRLYEKNSTDYTRFSKSLLRIAGDVDAFEITGNAKVTGTLTSGGILFANNDSYLKGTNYTGILNLHYGNLINVGPNYDHMVINYSCSQNITTNICDGLTNTLALFIPNYGLRVNGGTSCTWLEASGEVNLKGNYIKVGDLWLEYYNRITLSGNYDDDTLAINFSCWKTGEGNVNKNTGIYDGCYNKIAYFEPDIITLYLNTEIKGSLTVPSLTAQSFSTNSFNASSLSIGNVSVLDSCVSVGDVHVYNEDLSYSDLIGSILSVTAASLHGFKSIGTSTSYLSISDSDISFNIKKGQVLKFSGVKMQDSGFKDLLNSGSGTFNITWSIAIYLNDSLVYDTNNSIISSYGDSYQTVNVTIPDYTATADGVIKITRSFKYRNTISTNVINTYGTVTKESITGSNTTLLAKNAIGLLYDSLNYFIVGMDNGVMKMKFVSGGVSMFDSTYSALE